MIVEWHLLFVVAIELKAVVGVIPVDRRLEVYLAFFRLRLYGSECLEGMLKLVVPFGSVESVRAIVFCRDASMPVYPDVIIVIRALVERLPAAVVAVKAACTVAGKTVRARICLLYTSPSPRDRG